MMTISAGRVLKILLILIAAFVLLNLASIWLMQNPGSEWQTGMAKSLNMDSEASIPTWFNQSIWLVSSALALLIASAMKKAEDSWWKHWVAVGAVSLYISIDEGAALHEILANPTRSALGIQQGVLYFAWIIPMGAVVIAVVLAFLKFWQKLPVVTRTLFATAAGIFLAGSVGVEMVSAEYLSSNSRDAGFYLLTTLEESMEMIGVSVFIFALLDYLKDVPKKYLPVISFGE